MKWRRKLLPRGYSSVAEHSTADREVTGSTPVVPLFSVVCLLALLSERERKEFARGGLRGRRQGWEKTRAHLPRVWSGLRAWRDRSGSRNLPTKHTSVEQGPVSSVGRASDF